MLEQTPNQSAPKPMAAQPAGTQTGAAKPAATPANATPLAAKDQGKKTKRFVYGCCSFFGCSLLLFLALIFVFIGVGGTTENPIFGLFGVSGPEVVNVIILITNLIFGVLTFALFIITVIGVFKFATTKKEEKENRRKSAMLTFGALAILFILIFLWIFAYLFLKSKQTPIQRQAIITEPANTTNLTAPITIKFDAGKLPINKRRYQVLTYTWNFGDGESRTGNPLQTKTYEDKGRNDGRFDVKVAVSLRETTTGKELDAEYERIVTITNEQAQVVLEAKPDRGEAPLAVKFDASKSKDPDGEIQAFDWDLNEDGVFGDASGETAEYTFEKVGAYKVGVRVTEADGSFATAEKIIEVIGSLTPKPVIEIEGVPEAAEGDTLLYIGTNYTFSGANSVAPAGRIQKYEWDFGDGSGKKITRVATNIYQTAGAYEVTLKVTDDTGRTGETAKRIKAKTPEKSPVANVKTDPSASGGKISETVPVTVSFDASGSTDPDNDLVEYRWDFESDGKIDSRDAKTTHTYEAVGNFEAMLTLVDAAGNEIKWKIDIEVKSPGLQAKLQAEPTDGEVPLTVQFDASGSSYADNKIVAYEWDFGDGSEQRIDVAKITHQYTKIGTFTAKVSVVGADNVKTETETQIHVRSVSLNACFTPAPDTGEAPLDVLFDPSCTTGVAAKYKWTFGELGESRERKPIYRFTRSGTYTVTLEVMDNQNVSNTISKNITVK